MSPLADLLLAVVQSSPSDQQDRPTPPYKASVSRRGFLVLAGAAAAATPSSALPATALGADSPKIYRHGRAVVVALGRHLWVVDPTPFGPSAWADYRMQADAWQVRLSGARLPGTTLVVDFLARIERRAAGSISMAMPQIAFVAQASLADWITGTAALESRVLTGTIRIGPSTLNVGDGATMAVSPDPAWRISSPGGADVVALRLKGQVCVSAKSILLAFGTEPSSGLALRILDRRPERSTIFALDCPVLDRPAVHPGLRSDTTFAAFHHGAIDAVSGEAFEAAGRGAAVFLVEGSGHVARLGAKVSPLLHLERAAFTFSRGAGDSRCGLAGQIRQSPHTLDLGDVQATVTGYEAKPFFTVFHGRADESDLRAHVQLHSLRVPVSDADAAVVKTRAHPVELRFTADDIEEARSEYRGDSITANAAKAQMLLHLDEAEVSVRRGVDLVNLTFGLKGFDFKVSGGASYIERRHTPGHRKQWQAAQITVGFPPQHIAEEWVRDSELDPSKGLLKQLPTFSRLSGPSRIVFALASDGTASPLWKRVPLTVEALTDWSGLRLAVNRRAPAPDIPFDTQSHDRSQCLASPSTQMDIVCIGKDDSVSQAMAKIGASLTPPTADETVLEMAGRLIFSPSTEAGRRGVMTKTGPSTKPYYSGWETPRSLPDYRRAPLWSARLDANGRKTVRAIWSRMLSAGIYPPDFCDPKDDGDRSLLVLPADDHWEIVAQTSVFGMPALRRLKGPDDTDPVDTALLDLPSGEVTAAPDYAYLRALTAKPEDAGVAQPTPFQDADIILTALGGNFVANWRGEPPSLLFSPTLAMRLHRMLGGTLSTTKSLNVERFDYQSQLGRDVRIQVVNKGFLFPLGIRAAWVTLTERRIVIDNDASRTPVSIPVQRNFLIVQNPIKHWPALYQPFDGREFPSRSLQFQTLQTPDLLDPRSGTSPGGAGGGTVVVDSNGRLLFGGDNPNGPFVFWPKLVLPPAGASPDVDATFKWSLDDNPTPVESRLIFVENGAAGNAATMAQLVAYYRSLDRTDQARRAEFFGSRQRYAPADNSGKEVAFDTDHWVLGVQGRQNPAVGTGQPAEIFDLDARMNGADQPPFYPRVERAHIKLQTLEHLLGRNLGVAEVAYNAVYKAVGFDSVQNRAEIYLQVYGPNVDLDPAANGLKGSAGTVANPSARLAALSRRLGPVGGTGDAGVAPAPQLMHGSLKGLAPARRRRALASQQSQDDPTPFDFSKALDKGTFDPSQFMGQLGSAKLLGIVPLSEVVKAVAIDADRAAPQVIETLQYAAGEAGGSVVDALKTVASKLGDPLNQALAYLANAVQTFDQSGTPVPFAQLYPALSARFRAAQSALTATLAAIRAPNAEAGNVITNVTGTAAALKFLIGEAQRVLANPTPPVVDADITALVVDWNDLKAVFQGQFIPLDVITTIQNTMRDLFADLATAQLGSVLLGFDGIGWTTAEWSAAVEDPSAWADQVTDSLFADAFGDAISNLLTYVVGAVEEFTGDLLLAEGAFLSATRPIISDAINGVAGQLQAPAHTTDPNIINPARQDALIRAIRTGIQAKLDAAAQATPAPGNLTDLSQRIRDVLGIAKPAILNGAIAVAINAASADFILVGGGDPASVITTVKAQVSDNLTAAAAAQLGATASILQDDLARLGVTPKAAVLRLVELLNRTSVAMGCAAQVAAMSAIGQTAAGWCSTVAAQGRAAVDLADDYASGLLADKTNLVTALTNLLGAAQAIVPPLGATPGLVGAYSAVRGRLLGAIQDLASILQAVQTDRDRLHKVRLALQTDVCSNPGAFLGPTGDLIRGRHDAVKALGDIAGRLAEIAALDGGAAATAPVVVLVAPLFGQVTGIAAVAAAGATWSAIQGDFAMIGTVIGGDYQASLDEVRTKLAEQAAKLAATPPPLSDLAATVSSYVQDLEGPLLGLALQTVAFGDPEVRKVAIAAATILGRAAGFVELLHKTVGDLLDRVVTQLDQPTIRLIVNPKVVMRFKDAVTAIRADDATLTALVATAAALNVAAQPGAAPLPVLAGKLQDLVTKAANLADAWTTQPPAITSAIQAVADVADEILRGDLSALLNLPDLHMILEQIEEQGQALITSLVPTSAHLTYDWETPLETFDVAGAPLFYMQTPGDGLTLAVAVDIDFAADTRSATVKGIIKPFAIKLFGTADIATIKFDGAGFTSVNGQTPTFQAKVSGVELGSMMEFIEALQEYFSPGGGQNGFYNDLTLFPPGIEAGYIYSAPFIAVGELEFINISLKVCARLPFDGSAAEFEFDFASSELPFLIAAPPYGGGGYLQMIATAKGIQQFSLEFVFGGVAAIAFGPLSAQGRLVAGISVHQNGDDQNITALIEAVGEGNIACFGICVAITVGATRSGKGALQGFSDYSFSFSVGWITFTYGFRAGYTVQGGSSSGDNLMALRSPPSGQQEPFRRYRTLTPPKMRRWDAYKTRVSMDLLDTR